jgi:hypothetical protein
MFCTKEKDAITRLEAQNTAKDYLIKIANETNTELK